MRGTNSRTLTDIEPDLTPYLWRPTPVGELPMLWKEINIEPGMAFNWFGKLIVTVIVVVSLAPAAKIVSPIKFASPSTMPESNRPLPRDVSIWISGAVRHSASVSASKLTRATIAKPGAPPRTLTLDTTELAVTSKPAGRASRW